MYISKLSLRNFIGIFSGTGRTEISIDFPPPSESNKITLLLGANGCGKSTLLSTLHPFAGVFDSRNDQFIRQGHEGHKFLTIVDDDGSIYEIKHIFKPTRVAGKLSMKTYSYIAKDGTELNPNGGVNSFKTIIHELWGLEEDFFKIGKLASKTTNFIDMPIGERKSYIINLLPDLEPYLDAYKKASDKLKDVDKTVRYLTEELQSLGDESNITYNLETTESLNNTLKATLSEMIAKQAVIKKEIQTYQEEHPELKDTMQYNKQYLKLLDQADVLKNKVKATLERNSELEELVAKKETSVVEDIIAKKREVYNHNYNNLSKLEIERNNAKTKVQELYTTIEQTRIKLDNFYKDNSTRDKLDTTIFKLKEDNKIRQQALDNYQANDASFLDIIDRFDLQSNQVASYQVALRILDGLSSYKNIIKAHATFKDTSSLHDIEAELQAMEEQKRTLSNKILEATVQARDADILKDRPSECSIEACPFIQNGLLGLKAKKLLAGLKLEESDLEAKIQERNNVYDHVEAIDEINKTLSDLEERLKGTKLADYIIYIITNDSKATSLHDVIFKNVGFDLDKLGSLQETYKNPALFKAIDTLQELKEAEKQISIYEESLKQLESSKAYKELTEQELETAQASLVKAKKVMKDMEYQYDIQAKACNSEQALIKHLEDFIANRHKYSELIKQAKELKEKLDKHHANYEVYQKNLIAANEQDVLVIEAKDKLEDNEKQLRKLYLSKQRLDEYKERLANYQARATKISVVKDICDPKKGLPLQFMQDFLSSTESFANELFDIAFDGKFSIHFEVDDKNFTIPVTKDDGEVRPDVKYSSDGETSLIKTIVSLSLISRYNGNFPVFCLDEIDAVLDKQYRTNFINILHGQIKKLGLKQVFIISHNEELLDDSISLILFNGNTYSSNKHNTIVADFTN